MAFGQANGYPATRSQMEQLTDLILGAGHTDFRDARGPLGLTQRQAEGKFTRDEADELIQRLEAEADGTGEPDAPEPSKLESRNPTGPGRTGGARSGATQTAKGLAQIPSERLAAELQSRGWIVVEP
jgi:hypothetical protein